MVYEEYEISLSKLKNTHILILYKGFEKLYNDVKFLDGTCIDSVNCDVCYGDSNICTYCKGETALRRYNLNNGGTCTCSKENVFLDNGNCLSIYILIKFY